MTGENGASTSSSPRYRHEGWCSLVIWPREQPCDCGAGRKPCPTAYPEWACGGLQGHPGDCGSPFPAQKPDPGASS